jgi:hypothetical protein
LIFDEDETTLYLDLKPGDIFTVDGPAVITVRDCRHDKARVAIEADPKVRIERPDRKSPKSLVSDPKRR